MRNLLGLVVLVIVAGIAIIATQFDLSGVTRDTPAERVDVAIYYGGEKSAFLKSPQVQDLLDRKYRITLDATKAGSIEMVTDLDVSGKDCLWPSNAIAVDLAREAGRPVLGDEEIFGSPIVFYAWSEVADALEAKGVAQRDETDRLSADLRAIGTLIQTQAQWKRDLGLDIYGRFRVFSTDPTKSNSGNIWSALLATALNDGTPPAQGDLPQVLPQLTDYFTAMGYMESSSGDIFANFLKQGMGARPMIVGYENQLVEFLQENADYATLINDRIRVIYPEPTIFASHPLIELTPNCKRLTAALSDPEIQAIAWRDHGFRTGLIGVENDPSLITGITLPETVSQVVPMPSGAVMQTIIARLSQL